MGWQVQEATQRFSEVLRAVRDDGPQTITRHGEEVAVVIDIDRTGVRVLNPFTG